MESTNSGRSGAFDKFLYSVLLLSIGTIYHERSMERVIKAFDERLEKSHVIVAVDLAHDETYQQDDAAHANAKNNSTQFPDDGGNLD